MKTPVTIIPRVALPVPPLNAAARRPDTDQPMTAVSEHSSSSLPFLSDAELRLIAEPLKQPAAIRRWVEQAGFEAKRKPNGMPLISRSHFEQVMQGQTDYSMTRHSVVTEGSPDAAALLQRFAQSKRRRGD